MSPMTIVMFAQVPPPEHGQSRMVLLAVETLRGKPEEFDIHHINAKFSNTLDEIGENSLGKMVLIWKYLAQTIRVRLRVGPAILYYVPGPVKWSSVLRDWVLLSVLRRFFPRVVFHWHAIGHGEWAHGSERLHLNGPAWLDKVARKISSRVLDHPFASITVSNNSGKDALAVGSARIEVVHNGIADPCADFDHDIAPMRAARRRALATADRPRFRLLFLSHGTAEKGLIDAVDCLDTLMERCDPAWCFDVTFAGGVIESLRTRFEEATQKLAERWSDRLVIRQMGYLSGPDKGCEYIGHDVFLAPSRWESFGLTVVEAMACGMEVVAAASDGVQGVLPAGYPYLAPVANPTALANSLLECCKALRSDPARHAADPSLRERFREFYRIEDFSEKFTATVRDLARGSAPASSASKIQSPKSQIAISAYLADQNPGYDRSFGISRMSHAVLDTLQKDGRVVIETIVSKTSQQAPESVKSSRILPWGTRRKWVRLLTDHFHPLFNTSGSRPDLYYFPKGYLPMMSRFCRPSVVTIHDTIVQYDEDRYPAWRKWWEYAYWALQLKYTLRRADRVLTVSDASKRHIEAFMKRHRIAPKEIAVTYEPCLYESIAQPENPAKESYVIHLASCEPHKRSAHLIRWWHEAETQGRQLPTLHLIGSLPPEVAHLLPSSHSIVKRPFLKESALQAAYSKARALILPSEIEGFGLPALEAYYLGTPVCFVRGTSVEEVLGVATTKGGFSLDSADSLFAALEEVMAMPAQEIRDCGLLLRDTYAAEKVAQRMVAVFEEVAAFERLR